jgi:hypothetical protein
VHAKGSGGALLLLDTDDYDSAVRVTVYDRDRTSPSLREGYDAESGRGLWIVDTVTGGRWGTEHLGAAGKGVWFELGSGLATAGVIPPRTGNGSPRRADPAQVLRVGVDRPRS